MNKLICINVLLPALIETEKQKEMTDRCKKSLISLDNCVKVYIDKEPYKYAVAGVWNAFFDRWRGKDYDFLMITANDVVHDPHCIDYLVRCAKENLKAGVVSAKVIRDEKEFKKNFGQWNYTSRLTAGIKDPATFILRQGVIEKVGRVDQEFPIEFVERDYIYRAKLAGFDWIQPEVELTYHPPFSGTVGNSDERLRKAYQKYLLKWGGDANDERFLFPNNDLSLNYAYCRK